MSASKWTDDAKELARRLGAIGIPEEQLRELGAAAEKSGQAVETAVPALKAFARRLARFPITWNFDRSYAATVLISRGAGTISVRPYKRRKVYTLPLAFVAELIAERVTKAEVAAKIKTRKAKRRGRR